MGADIVRDYPADFTPDRETWLDRAACKGQDVNKFVTADRAQMKESREFCLTRCPVQRECLVFILVREQGWRRQGVFGGTTPTERDELAEKLGLSTKKEEEDDTEE